jgi:hypothetical protein
MAVLVVEYQEPNNYVVATSTGSDASKHVWKFDESKPCPSNDTRHPDCIATRVPLSELTGNPMDTVLRRAFIAHRDANFPTTGWVSVKESDVNGSQAYVVQGRPYNQSNAKNLEWHILVVIPMDRSTKDAALPGDSIFVAVCIIASMGVLGCFSLFLSFYAKRLERAVMHADWRFTSAFILGCSALNFSSFTLLGPNTDSMCMLRMWSFNGLFVIGMYICSM